STARSHLRRALCSGDLPFNRFLELPNLPFGQPSRLSRRHIKCQRTVAHAPDLFHVMADLFEHLPELPVLALGESDLIPGIRGLLDDANACGCGAGATARLSSLTDGNALTQFLDRSFVRLAAHFDQVRLLHMRTCLHEFVRHLAIIGY